MEITGATLREVGVIFHGVLEIDDDTLVIPNPHRMPSRSRTYNTPAAPPASNIQNAILHNAGGWEESQASQHVDGSHALLEHERAYPDRLSLLRALPSSFAALQTSRQTIPALAVSRPPLALHPHVGPHPARVALLALRLMSSHLCPLSP